MWHDGDETSHIMYERKEGKPKPQRTTVHQFPTASKAINEMMLAVVQALGAHDVLRRKLFQVNYHTALSGEAMVTLVYHKKLEPVESEWRAAAQNLRCARRNEHHFQRGMLDRVTSALKAPPWRSNAPLRRCQACLHLA
jgi:tRNA (uracil-5-)-methyltransferase